MGQLDLSGCCAGGAAGIPSRYFWKVFTATDSFQFNYAIQQSLGAGTASDNRFFNVLNVDSTLSDKYGGDKLFVLYGQQLVNVPGSAYTGAWGLSIALGGAGLGGNDRYNGFRWFNGPSPQNNETMANPTAGNCGTGVGACASTPSLNNAGSLTGVATVYMPRSYLVIDREWRNIEASTSGVVRAADFNVTWGANGQVASVVDITHNTAVPFDATLLSGGWAILNTNGQGAGSQDGRPTVLTPADWLCVQPFRSVLTQPDNTFFPCTTGTSFTLSNTAVPGAIAMGAGSQQSSRLRRPSHGATRPTRRPTPASRCTWPAPSPSSSCRAAPCRRPARCGPCGPTPGISGADGAVSRATWVTTSSNPSPGRSPPWGPSSGWRTM
jgi:hypothetical protein